MCKVEIKDGELRIEMKFSDRPLQIVKLDEITGITIMEDRVALGLCMVAGAVTAISLIYAFPLGIFMALITALILWQYWNRGRVTLIHARSHTLLLRGKHPEIWEKIKEARK